MRRGAPAAALLLAAAAAWLPGCGEPPSEEALETEEIAAPESARSRLLRLYFPGPAGALIAEERELPPMADRAELIRAVAAGVLEGPRDEVLRSPFPEGVELGSVHLSAESVVYIDLLSPQPAPPASGSRDEMLSVFSLVNSVLLAVPELEGVVLLWNGQQRPTFAGHLDTGQPLAAKLDLVAERAKG